MQNAQGTTWYPDFIVVGITADLEEDSWFNLFIYNFFIFL